MKLGISSHEDIATGGPSSHCAAISTLITMALSSMPRINSRLEHFPNDRKML